MKARYGDGRSVGMSIILLKPESSWRFRNGLLQDTRPCLGWLTKNATEPIIRLALTTESQDSMCNAGLQQVQRPCALDRLKATVGVKFAVDVLDVVPDGPHDNHEFPGNLVGGEASGDEPEYLALPLAQRVNQHCWQR